MIAMELDTSDLLRLARHFDTIPRKSQAAIAKALNTVGEQVVRAAATYMAEQSGLDIDAIQRRITVKEADSDDLSWEMDASQVAPPSLDWSRPWDKPTSDAFDQDVMVKITTMEDDVVCEICLRAAEGGPYTLATAKEMFTHGGNGHAGLHPNCRCVLEPWSNAQRVEVTFAHPGAAPPQLFSLRSIGKKIAEELSLVMRVVEDA